MGSKLLYEVFRDHPKAFATLWRDPHDPALNLTSSEMLALTHVLTVMQDPPAEGSCIYFESREQLQTSFFPSFTPRSVVNLARSLFSKLSARGLVTEVARGRRGADADVPVGTRAVAQACGVAGIVAGSSGNEEERPADDLHHAEARAGSAGSVAKLSRVRAVETVGMRKRCSYSTA